MFDSSPQRLETRAAMAWPADYHMHTFLCRHAVGSASDLAAAAVRRGLHEIGFSEHNPMVRDDFSDWHMLLADLGNYVEQVAKARRDFPQLAIRMALEVDFIPGHEEWIRDLAARHPWDYLIGSVHYVSESWDLDNPRKLSEWRTRNPWDVWSLYFERLTLAAESRLFEIIGHADLCKKFCFYPDRDTAPLYRPFLEAAQRSDVAIEINTAGLRKDCREMYPSRAILEAAHELGVPLTFGSDAHAPEEVGMNFFEAVELARSVGYGRYCTFSARRRDTAPI